MAHNDLATKYHPSTDDLPSHFSLFIAEEIQLMVADCWNIALNGPIKEEINQLNLFSPESPPPKLTLDTYTYQKLII